MNKRKMDLQDRVLEILAVLKSLKLKSGEDSFGWIVSVRIWRCGPAGGGDGHFLDAVNKSYISHSHRCESKGSGDSEKKTINKRYRFENLHQIKIVPFTAK